MNWYKFSRGPGMLSFLCPFFPVSLIPFWARNRLTIDAFSLPNSYVLVSLPCLFRLYRLFGNKRQLTKKEIAESHGVHGMEGNERAIGLGCIRTGKEEEAKPLVMVPKSGFYSNQGILGALHSLRAQK